MKKRLLLKFFLIGVFNVLLADAPAYTLKTNTFVDDIKLNTRLISFCDTNGKKITDEKPFAGRNFNPAVFDGNRYHHFTPTFQSTDGDASYSPGQHPGAVINYRGQQASFFQNNTKVVIPFLVPGKNDGILWYSYSLAKHDDSRLPHPLFVQQLFSKKGAAGWLTASHANDGFITGIASVKRAETGVSINFSWDEAAVAGSYYPSGWKRKYSMKEKTGDKNLVMLNI